MDGKQVTGIAWPGENRARMTIARHLSLVIDHAIEQK